MSDPSLTNITAATTMTDTSPNMFARLRCVKEGSKLRVKIISSGYTPNANCQFPRNIRVVGREYLVPHECIRLVNRTEKWFYHVKVDSRMSMVDENTLDLSAIKVYDSGEAECVICLSGEDKRVIVPCGHYAVCSCCVVQIKKCPLCRMTITTYVERSQIGGDE